jgi:hypothetical protein
MTSREPSPDLLIRGEYKKILEFYPQIKRLVCLCEKVDLQQRANLSPIAEMRSALDHIMRAHSRLYGISSQFEDEPNDEPSDESRYEYCRKHLDKARGHLYRAGYDAYDVISMTLLDDIYAMENSVSKDAFYTVIPDGSELLKKADKAKEWFTAAKSERDIEISTKEQGTQFEEYENANIELAEIRNTISSYMRQLIEFDSNKAKKDRKQTIINISSISIGILGLIAAIVALFLK